MQIAAAAKEIPHLQRIYVKGHQDGKKKKADLTQPELYNIDADASATIMRHEMKKPASHIITFPASQVNVYIQQQHISSSMNTIFHEMYSGADYWEYLERKFEWTTQTRKLVEWDTYHKALRKQTTKQHQQLMKYVNEWLPTGKTIHRNDAAEDHRCPHYHTVYETDLHLL
jgi:hypothetical protein